MNYPENPNPNPNFYSYFPNNNSNNNMMVDHQLVSEFEPFDYLIFDDDRDHHQGLDHYEDSKSSQSIVSSEKMIMSRSSNGAISEDSDMQVFYIKCKNGMKKMNEEVTQKVAFRTKSELEIMDDGFKWRKYGKKSVKNSPNPRNYYRCSSGGCQVKKRVERDREDSSYVITTYEGIHNHESPCAVYDYHHDHHQTAQNYRTLEPSSSSPPPPPSSFSSS